MTTKFSEIVVDSANHGYRLGNQNLISITTLLKSIIPEFDRDTISLKMAERAGISQAEILKQWDAKGAFSRDKGTRVHQYIEDVIGGTVDPLLQRVNYRVLEMNAFDDAWTKLRSEMDAKMIKQEWVVGDAEFGVAGRLDNLMSMQVPQLPRFGCVLDWKTGKLNTSNQYERLLPPFDAFDNCKLNIYSVQLSLYRLIIERNKPDVKLSDGYILHLREDGSYQFHRGRDFRPQISEWLKNGVPKAARCDPATERRASDIIKLLDLTVDDVFMSKLSERARNELSRAAIKVTHLGQVH